MSSPDLRTPVKMLRIVGSIAYSVSPEKIGFHSTTGRAFDIRLLFSRVFQIYTSILRLVTTSPPARRASAVPDPPTIGALTRNLIEAHDALWHIGLQQVTRDESEFRREIWSIHYHRELEAICSQLRPDDTHLVSFHQALAMTALLNLKHNPFFKSLPLGAQESIARGRRAFYGRIDNEPRKRVLSNGQLRAFYKYLSNHTHTTSLSVWLGFHHKWSRAFDNEYLLRACLDVAARELALATHGYVKHLRLGAHLDSDDWIILRNLPRQKVEWIQTAEDA